METPIRKLTVLVLAVAVGLLAFAGVSVAAGSDADSGQTAQEPLGSKSAPSTDKNDTQGEFGSSDTPADDTPSSDSPDSSGTLPDNDSGDAPAGSSLPSADTGSSPSSSAAKAGSQGASLPFTGFLAIPVLLLGVALLATGLVLRRRSTAGPLSA